MHNDKVYLVGFMGSGKTSLGHELARKLGSGFVDLDEQIEASEGMSATQIFRTWGEAYFRALETAMLQNLSAWRAVVISTGGGTFVQKANREFMLGDGLVVWPFTPFEVCWKRLMKPGEREKRPLLQQPKAEVRKLFDSRRPAYRQAHLVVNGMAAPETLAQDIIKERRNYW